MASTRCEPGPLVLRQRGTQEAVVPLPAEDRQAALRLALSRLRQVLEQQAPAEHRIGRFGQRMALATAQGAVLAEVIGDDAVGGVLEAQHAMQQLGGVLEQGVRMHRPIILGACCGPRSSGATARSA